jgi:hypothetical protein
MRLLPCFKIPVPLILNVPTPTRSSVAQNSSILSEENAVHQVVNTLPVRLVVDQSLN